MRGVALAADDAADICAGLDRRLGGRRRRELVNVEERRRPARRDPRCRPADGSEDQTASDLSVGSRSVAELSQSQRTGQVAPEQNLVPGEQRPVAVEGWFGFLFWAVPKMGEAARKLNNITFHL